MVGEKTLLLRPGEKEILVKEKWFRKETCDFDSIWNQFKDKAIYFKVYKGENLLKEWSLESSEPSLFRESSWDVNRWFDDSTGYKVCYSEYTFFLKKNL
ncbi:MAG: hypothetical protein IKT11_00765 [Bacteroidales bacterium]|nr:hypothetical protein [Bacteroidales bacterium]